MHWDGGGPPFLTPPSLGRGSHLPRPAGRRTPQRCPTPSLPAPHGFLRWVPPQASRIGMGEEGWVPPTQRARAPRRFPPHRVPELQPCRGADSPARHPRGAGEPHAVPPAEGPATSPAHRATPRGVQEPLGGVTLWSPLLWHPILPSHCQVARLSVAEPPPSPAPKGSNPGRGPETGQLWGSPAARGNPGDDGKAGSAGSCPPATHIPRHRRWQCHVLQNAWVLSIFGGGTRTWGDPLLEPFTLEERAVGWSQSHPGCPQGMVVTLSHSWGPGQLWGGFEGL